MSDYTFHIDNGSTTISSWVCGKCGALCNSNKAHLCSMGSGNSSTPNYYNALSPIFLVDAETKRLLDRIATALEKLAGIGE